jgi:hypothetical protein
MTRRSGGAALAVVGAVMMTFASASARAAGGPVIIRMPVDDVAVANFCGFPLELRTTGTAFVHLFLDDEGAFERVLITAPETRLTFTNLNTGASIWTPSVNMVQQSLNDDGTGTTTLRGLFWRLVVPGEGLITADVGRLDFLVTFDEEGNVTSEEVVFVAGIQENAFLPAVCAALG